VDILADTNILLRRIHRGSPQHRQTRDAINRLSKNGYRFFVASQNLIELWAVCTRPVDNNGLGLSPAYVERILTRIELSVARLPESDAVYAEWRRLVSLHEVSGKKTHDARLVAAMNVNGVSHILTFNAADFSRYSGITVIEPHSYLEEDKG
jgi:predicted nucleic acid-binding protein